jgi:hypothetical protein
MDANRLHVSPGIDRTPGRPRRRLLTVACTSLAALATLVVATAAPASAATVNGVATIASPGTTTPLNSGGSTTQFTVSLPTLAACSGDTATHGYHVYSYLERDGKALSGVTFVNFPSAGFGFVNSLGTYYGPANTAVGTGQIVAIPNNLEWGPLVSADSVPLSTLLYTGSGASASGIWDAGLVCANTHGAVVDNWNTDVTFVAHAADPNGFTWTAVPGSNGVAPAFTSAASTKFVKGVAGKFTPTATGTPTPTITESGTLPTGVTFTGGVLSGKSTKTGTFPITFTARNGFGPPVTQSFTLKVLTIEITTTSLPKATRGTAYSAKLTELGGLSPFTWKTNVALPKGLTLNPTTGKISGTTSATAAIGTFPIVFTVTDSATPTKDTASATISLKVKA